MWTVFHDKAAHINLRSRTLPSVVYISATDTRTNGGNRDKNVFVGASVRILRRPNNYIPRVVPRRPSPRVRVSFGPRRIPSFRSIFYLCNSPSGSRLENFDTRGAVRSLARSKLHPLRARHFNTSPPCLRRTWPRIPLLISRERVSRLRRASWRFNLYLPDKFTDDFGDLRCIGWRVASPRGIKKKISIHQQHCWINSSPDI